MNALERLDALTSALAEARNALAAERAARVADAVEFDLRMRDLEQQMRDVRRLLAAVAK